VCKIAVRGATIEHGMTAILRTLSGLGLAYLHKATHDLSQIALSQPVAQSVLHIMADT
jgi:hypothetical protein